MESSQLIGNRRSTAPGSASGSGDAVITIHAASGYQSANNANNNTTTTTMTSSLVAENDEGVSPSMLQAMCANETVQQQVAFLPQAP
jgi:hypothetical protein